MTQLPGALGGLTESAFRRLEVALSSLGINIVRSTNRLGRQAVPSRGFSWFSGRPPAPKITKSVSKNNENSI